MSKPEEFDERMMRLYPSLFPKDDDGNIREPECGLCCPYGWQHLVERLCAAIVWRVENPREVQVWRSIYAVQTFIYRKCFVPIYNVLYRWVDPLESLHWKDGKREVWIMINQKQRKGIEEKYPLRTKLTSKLGKISFFLRPRMRFKKVPTPPVTIDQVKEKFGTLRFYYSGGDTNIAEMVSMVERISEVTCEETGAPGKMHVRGAWYKTLSKDAGEARGYKPAK